ncbi:MAG: ribonucleotide reductase N-terminal alpha domain-containing protein [Candidatus Omnitrophota bacterium]|nr:ribonucleotide reductase N-terminal alpha domain-containing protein [Candidatus Omnitrophota bacterium]
MALKLSENSLKVLEKRYLIKNGVGKVVETPEGLFRRVAGAIASADKLYNKTDKEILQTEEAFYRIMTALEFMPNSPALMNAGKELSQLSACFTLPIDDSMESIFETLKATSLIHQSGGGTGFSFSRLRSKNSMVRTTGGVASGPISFMKVYDAATEAVKQGGTRRGANMGILRVDHPDILEFITCKENNKEITNFNISVAVTDDFMQKLAKFEDYDLIDPHTNKAVQRLSTKKVFDLIVKQAHKNGEPGIIFIDRINQYNPTPKLGKIESTNPCVIGDTFVSTEKGLLKIKDLAYHYSNGGLGIFTDDRVSDILYGEKENGTVLTQTKLEVSLNTISAAFKTGVKPVLKLVTESGFELIATTDHKIMTENGWVMMQDLKPCIHKVLIQSSAGKFNDDAKLPFEIKKEELTKDRRISRLNLPSQWSKELGQVLGWLIGDGWLRDGDENCRAGFTFSRDDAEVLDYLKPIINNFYGIHIKEVLRENNVYYLSYHSKYFVDFFKKLGVNSCDSGAKEVPASMFTATQEAVVGFLQGLFTADGTIGYVKDVNSYIRLTSKSLKLLQGVQLLLINLGIKSKIYDRLRQGREGFEYISKNGEKRIYKLDGLCFELSISKDMVLFFLERIGFLCNKHSLKIKKLLSKSYYSSKFIEEIKSIEPYGEQEVYDLTEPQTLTFISNGFISLDCGEQPILPYESCDLGSINLSRVIKEGKTGAYEIDWEKLKDITHLAVHFLDNLIDVNKFPLPTIEKATKLTRKIGLGAMGWASLLIQLKIPYNSDKAVNLAEQVMSFILNEATKKSLELAETKGVFPAFEGSIYDTEKGAKGLRLRNATLTTIAPTGTISIIAGPCSSGIEPLFALSYYRNVMDNNKLTEVEPLFEEVARNRGFYSAELMERVAQKGSIHDFKDIPEDVRKVFVTSHDISPEWHVRMQAAFQKYTNNAVSKTVNFSHEASIEDVRKTYLLAYELDCKGITIYRDRSREEQVLNIGNQKQEVKTLETKLEARIETKKEIAPRPRPEVINGTTTKVSTGCGNLYITINTDENGTPFELFTQMGKAGGCAASQLEAVGRLVSLAFRAGIEVKSIIEQLRNIRCPSPSWEKGQRIFSCADAIARVIEKRLINGAAVSASLVDTNIAMKHSSNDSSKVSDIEQKGEVVGVCPDCGGTLRHEEGCVKCQGCGYSKC